MAQKETMQKQAAQKDTAQNREQNFLLVPLPGNRWDREPVENEQYKEVMQVTDTFRRRMQDHGCCALAWTAAYRCNADCCTCRYHIPAEREIPMDPADIAKLREQAQERPWERVTENEVLEKNFCAYLFNELRLSPVDKEIIEQCMDKLPDAMIAEKLHMSRRTVTSHKNKAKAKLRKLLEIGVKGE